MKLLAEGAIGTGAGTLAYTATTSNGYNVEINDIQISNDTAAVITIALYLVPPGGAVGTTPKLFPTIGVPANTMMHWPGTTVLNNGGFIQAIAGGAGLSMRISGKEVPV